MTTTATQCEISTCEATTHHGELGQTGSCLCGFKKYAKPKGLDLNNLPTCGWCSAPPSIADIKTREVFCATEGCPAFSNVVTAERWCERGVHEMEVMWIPAEEPIFVMRGQDGLALVPIYTWVDLAEKKKVPEEKVNSAVTRAEAIQSFQRAMPGGPKIPD